MNLDSVDRDAAGAITAGARLDRSARGCLDQKLKCVRFRKRPSRLSWGLLYAFFVFIGCLLSLFGGLCAMARDATPSRAGQAIA
jgi:hypothetical protein